MKIWNKNSVSYIVIVIVALQTLYKVFDANLWKDPNRVINYDVTYYYSYLPATFIFKDPTLEFTKKNPSAYLDKFVSLPTPTGKLIIKMSMGLSFLYAPFFTLAHFLAPILGYEANGYTEPYRLALILSSVFFMILGLIFLKKILIRYFSPIVTSITLLAIGLGTNLFYYTAIRSAMSHSYNFTLITIFIYLTILWYEKPKNSFTILIGLLAGLITLIRPSNVLILFFFLLYRVTNLLELKNRLIFFISKFKQLIIITLLFIVIWIPQMIYWKMVAGHFLYFSYQGEQFFFNNPQIINILFSYRSGWLVYTPVMTLAILGLTIIWFRMKEFFWPILVYFVLTLYVLSSWWCWWYVGLGNRSFIDLYGVLAIPLAALINWFFEKTFISKLVISLVIAFFINLNLHQTWQYQAGLIHHDSMSKKAYWLVFMKKKLDNKYWSYLKHPDYQKALNGIYEDLPTEKKQ